MIVWIDEQISPDLAGWFARHGGATAFAMRDLGMKRAPDREIFGKARLAGAAVLTKDRDFADLVTRLGPPPQVIWLTCGNTSNAHLEKLLALLWPEVRALLARGEALVEISGFPVR